jgi:hypothetical protein
MDNEDDLDDVFYDYSEHTTLENLIHKLKNSPIIWLYFALFALSFVATLWLLFDEIWQSKRLRIK